MRNQLFLTGGLPSSGKSITSQFIAKFLEKQGKKVVWIDEGTGNHPADYEFHRGTCNIRKLEKYISALSSNRK